MPQFDIIVVGAGLAGAAFASALRAAPLRLALLEARAPAPPAPGAWDSRVYALSPASERFLREIAAWRHLDPARLTPVHDMEIFGDGSGSLRFSAFDSGVEALAWIVESGLIQRELWESLRRQPNLELLCPASPRTLRIEPDEAVLGLADGRTLTARLVVAADGVDSWVREQAGMAARIGDYGERGVVANFACELPHRHRAFQWFRPDGVLAWLPLPGERFSMVWSAPEDLASELLALPGDSLCERVAAAGGRRLGALALVTPPQAFPLRIMRVARTVAHRVALIGDAAHAIHPLSGHGINLGFQDARVLARVLAQRAPHRDPGEERLLRDYERERAEEVLALQAVTHGLHQLFRSRLAPLAWARNVGLNLTGQLPLIRHVLARYAMGQ